MIKDIITDRERSMTPEVLILKDYIIAGAAFVGAVLGIMNTWNALNQRRVRLRVTPADAVYIGDHKTPPGFSISVVNLSTFPVTIKEVGFTLRGFRDRKRRLAILEPDIIDDKPYPRRLEARESFSAYFNHIKMMRDNKIGKAYARTSCGVIRTGSSPSLRHVRKLLKS